MAKKKTYGRILPGGGTQEVSYTRAEAELLIQHGGVVLQEVSDQKNPKGGK